MIRELRKADINQVADIWLDTNIKAHYFIPAQYWKSNLELVKELLLQATVYVYEDNQKIQGFIGLNGEYIEGIFVSEAMQSQSIGKRLLNYVKNTRSKLILNVYQKNTPAISFYQREGFEIQVSKPRVLMKEQDGKRLEPIEMALIDVDDSYTGVVIEKMGIRKGEMVSMIPGTDGYTRLEFKVPARGLIGFRNEFLTDTKGTGILNHSFYDYEPHKGEIPTLIATEPGVTVAYALNNIQDRGTLFLDPGIPVYEGMIVGEHSRENDLVVNVCKTKKLTNMRAAGSDDAVKLAPPRKFTLEQALDYIADDELVEVTPENIRLRKKYLKEGERRKYEKRNEE